MLTILICIYITLIKPSLSFAIQGLGPIFQLKNEDVISMNDITIFTIVNGSLLTKFSQEFQHLKGFIGSIHRLRGDDLQFPNIKIFYLNEISSPSIRVEIEWWKRVDLIKIDDFLKISNYETSTNALINLIEQRLLQENMLIFWIKQGFLIENPLFNPFYAPDRQKPGPLNQKDYNDSIKSQRSSFLHLFKEGNTIFLDNNNNEKVAFIKKKLQTTASIVKNCIKNNIVPFNMKSEPKCQIQINHYLPISYGKLMLPTFETPKILQYSKNQKKIIALGIPLATKKRVSFQEISLKKFLLDSLIVTISKEERGKFIFILYIAYDEGDPTLDFHNDVFFKELQKFTAPYKSFLHVKLYRIPPIQRVATIWNILFVKAVQEGMHYFYQLNDDIQFITTNWATKLTSMLDSSDGYGVAGPSDLDNEWNCRVLTQGMVTIKHYQLFNELLYPTEFINWKSDRWLTQLYRRAKQDMMYAISPLHGKIIYLKEEGY